MCKLVRKNCAVRSAKVRTSYVMGTQSVVSAVSQSAANQSTSTCVCSASSAVSAKKQLEEALKINEPLAKAYYLKEKITLVWGQLDKAAARAWLYDWIREAIRSEVTQLIKAGLSMFKHREGILAWYDKKITTAMVEGINNKIKVMKPGAWASQTTVISSFVCWPCTMPVSRHSCEDPKTDDEISTNA